MASKQQDIISLIETDHRKVEQIFMELESSKNAEQMYNCFNQLYKELNLHSEAEELVFYAAMYDFEETEGFIAEAEEEHEEAEILLEELRTLNPAEAEFQEKIQQLKEAVMHHVQEEEQEIFPVVRQVMGEKELQQMAEDFMEAKTRVEEVIAEAMMR